MCCSFDAVRFQFFGGFSANVFHFDDFSFLGMGPQHAMQIAERLYTQGYISYPRTETNSYPENFDLVCVLFCFSLKKVVWVDDILYSAKFKVFLWLLILIHVLI